MDYAIFQYFAVQLGLFNGWGEPYQVPGVIYDWQVHSGQILMLQLSGYLSHPDIRQ